MSALPPVMHVELSTNPTILILTYVLLSGDTNSIPCAFCSCAVNAKLYTNQSKPYRSTGVSGSITGVGLDRQLVWYYWLIPNCKTKDGIGIVISWVRGAGVKGTKGLKCGSNGWIILDQFNGCIGCVVGRSGNVGSDCRLGCTRMLALCDMVPSVRQEGVMIIICVRTKGEGA